MLTRKRAHAGATIKRHGGEVFEAAASSTGGIANKKRCN